MRLKFVLTVLLLIILVRRRGYGRGNQNRRCCRSELRISRHRSTL